MGDTITKQWSKEIYTYEGGGTQSGSLVAEFADGTKNQSFIIGIVNPVNERDTANGVVPGVTDTVDVNINWKASWYDDSTGSVDRTNGVYTISDLLLVGWADGNQGEEGPIGMY